LELREVNILADRSKRSRLAIVAFAAIAGASLIWGRGFAGFADGQTTKNELTTASVDRSAAPPSQDSLDLNEKQTGMVKTGVVGTREFAQLKTAVGTIDFNENMLVQVFSQYPGKILKAFFNIGDDVKQGGVLFTIDSPDLLQAESTLLAAAGVLELQKRTLARATGLLKAGGSA
jgi:membrane fusion protein, heavy metal efflux system